MMADWKTPEWNIEGVAAACLFASDGDLPSVSAFLPSAFAAAFAALLLHHPLVLLLRCDSFVVTWRSPNACKK